jgi:gamma-glutamyl phosphate reductase
MLIEMGQLARAAYRQMSNAETGVKNKALRGLAARIDQSHDVIRLK